MASLLDAARPAVYHHPRSPQWAARHSTIPSDTAQTVNGEATSPSELESQSLSNDHTNKKEAASRRTADISEQPATINAEETEQQMSQQKDGAQDEGNLSLREEYVDRVWDDFVTQFLLGSQHIQRAAIFDLASRRSLASRGGLDISTEEMEQLVISLHHHEMAYRNGVTIGGKSYKVQLADGRNGIMARTEREGCTVCKTQTLIILGVHDENGTSRRCNEEVMRLGDFFRRKAL